MFTGNEDQEITLSTAVDLTANYRTSLASGICSTDPTLGHYFSRKTLLAILAQDGCVGARVYYGQTATGVKEPVIVGVAANENDLYEGFKGDRSYKSPPHGSLNPLNS